MYVFNQDQIAKDLLAKREKENLTFRECQKLSGVPVFVLHKIESNNHSRMSVDIYASICNFLGKPIDYYFQKKTQVKVSSKSKPKSNGKQPKQG